MFKEINSTLLKNKPFLSISQPGIIQPIKHFNGFIRESKIIFIGFICVLFYFFQLQMKLFLIFF
jgi:hypothetical protein